MLIDHEHRALDWELEEPSEIVPRDEPIMPLPKPRRVRPEHGGSEVLNDARSSTQAKRVAIIAVSRSFLCNPGGCQHRSLLRIALQGCILLASCSPRVRLGFASCGLRSPRVRLVFALCSRLLQSEIVAVFAEAWRFHA